MNPSRSQTPQAVSEHVRASVARLSLTYIAPLELEL
jgi:hypothetical protein